MWLNSSKPGRRRCGRVDEHTAARALPSVLAQSLRLFSNSTRIPSTSGHWHAPIKVSGWKYWTIQKQGTVDRIVPSHRVDDGGLRQSDAWGRRMGMQADRSGGLPAEAACREAPCPWRTKKRAGYPGERRPSPPRRCAAAAYGLVIWFILSALNGVMLSVRGCASGCRPRFKAGVVAAWRSATPALNHNLL